MNNQSQLFLRLLAGGYIIYLGYQSFCAQLAGESDMAPLLGYGLPVLLMLGGLAVLGFTGKQYLDQRRKQKEAGQQTDEEDSGEYAD